MSRLPTSALQPAVEFSRQDHTRDGERQKIAQESPMLVTTTLVTAINQRTGMFQTSLTSNSNKYSGDKAECTTQSRATPRCYNCYNCHKEGHKTFECMSGKRCHVCGMDGHLARECKSSTGPVQLLPASAESIQKEKFRECPVTLASDDSSNNHILSSYQRRVPDGRTFMLLSNAPQQLDATTSALLAGSVGNENDKHVPENREVHELGDISKNLVTRQSSIAGNTTGFADQPQQQQLKEQQHGLEGYDDTRLLMLQERGVTSTNSDCYFHSNDFNLDVENENVYSTLLHSLETLQCQPQHDRLSNSVHDEPKRTAMPTPDGWMALPRSGPEPFLSTTRFLPAKLLSSFSIPIVSTAGELARAVDMPSAVPCTCWTGCLGMPWCTCPCDTCIVQLNNSVPKDRQEGVSAPISGTTQARTSAKTPESLTPVTAYVDSSSGAALHTNRQSYSLFSGDISTQFRLPSVWGSSLTEQSTGQQRLSSNPICPQQELRDQRNVARECVTTEAFSVRSDSVRSPQDHMKNTPNSVSSAFLHPPSSTGGSVAGCSSTTISQPGHLPFVKAETTSAASASLCPFSSLRFSEQPPLLQRYSIMWNSMGHRKSVSSSNGMLHSPAMSPSDNNWKTERANPRISTPPHQMSNTVCTTGCNEMYQAYRNNHHRHGVFCADGYKNAANHHHHIIPIQRVVILPCTHNTARQVQPILNRIQTTNGGAASCPSKCRLISTSTLGSDSYKVPLNCTTSVCSTDVMSGRKIEMSQNTCTNNGVDIVVDSIKKIQKAVDKLSHGIELNRSVELKTLHDIRQLCLSSLKELDANHHRTAKRHIANTTRASIPLSLPFPKPESRCFDSSDSVTSVALPLIGVKKFSCGERCNCCYVCDINAQLSQKNCGCRCENCSCPPTELTKRYRKVSPAVNGRGCLEHQADKTPQPAVQTNEVNLLNNTPEIATTTVQQEVQGAASGKSESPVKAVEVNLLVENSISRVLLPNSNTDETAKQSSLSGRTKVDAPVNVGTITTNITEEKKGNTSVNPAGKDVFFLNSTKSCKIDGVTFEHNKDTALDQSSPSRLGEIMSSTIIECCRNEACNLDSVRSDHITATPRSSSDDSQCCLLDWLKEQSVPPVCPLATVVIGCCYGCFDDSSTNRSVNTTNNKRSLA